MTIVYRRLCVTEFSMVKAIGFSESFANASEPVSYTHLDVYKRQVFISIHYFTEYMYQIVPDFKTMHLGCFWLR